MTDAGYIQLVDFGISKQLDGAGSKTRSIRGTPEYMAPEMLKKQGYSLQIDWWALGTICFELLTGQAPFYDEDES